MNWRDILNDKSIKSKAKRKKIVDAILGGDLTLADIEKIIGSIGDEQVTVILEAIDEIAKNSLRDLDIAYLQLAEKYIASGSDTVKRAASMIVGDLAKHYPDKVDSAVKALIRNINDKSKEVREGSAYGISKILELKEYASSSLHNIASKIMEQEPDKKIKKIYNKTLKKLAKKRK